MFISNNCAFVSLAVKRKFGKTSKSLKYYENDCGFSKTIELCLNFCMDFCITQLVLSNYNKINPKKSYFNHVSHLKGKVCQRSLSIEVFQ